MRIDDNRHDNAASAVGAAVKVAICTMAVLRYSPCMKYFTRDLQVTQGWYHLPHLTMPALFPSTAEWRPLTLDETFVRWIICIAITVLAFPKRMSASVAQGAALCLHGNFWPTQSSLSAL